MTSLKTELELITPPTSNAVTLSEAKAWLREDRDVEDAVIEAMIDTAERRIRSFTGHDFLTTEYILHLPYWSDFKIPKQPFSDIVEIKFDAPDGTEQSLSTDDYTVHTMTSPVSVSINTDQKTADVKYPIRVKFTSGYSIQANIPDEFKTLVKIYLMVLHSRDMDVESPFELKLFKDLLGGNQIGRFK